MMLIDLNRRIEGKLTSHDGLRVTLPSTSSSLWNPTALSIQIKVFAAETHIALPYVVITL